jgi:fatty acid desaturase
MAFGNGFLMHPLIFFWLMQHHCSAKHVTPNVTKTPSSSALLGWVDDASAAAALGGNVSLQPTLSYTGSGAWNLLNFNQLSHTEHHDFARVSWRRAPMLRALAPEFYDDAPGLERVSSLRAFLWQWVATPGDKMNFACIGATAPVAVPPPLPGVDAAKGPALKKVD